MDTFDNLAKYKIFLSAAENKSISKAAAQLYISQPAVSITIKKLEENLIPHFLSEDQRVWSLRRRDGCCMTA